MDPADGDYRPSPRVKPEPVDTPEPEPAPMPLIEATPMERLVATQNELMSVLRDSHEQQKKLMERVIAAQDEKLAFYSNRIAELDSEVKALRQETDGNRAMIKKMHEENSVTNEPVLLRMVALETQMHVLAGYQNNLKETAVGKRQSVRINQVEAQRNTNEKTSAAATEVAKAPPKKRGRPSKGNARNV